MKMRKCKYLKVIGKMNESSCSGKMKMRKWKYLKVIRKMNESSCSGTVTSTYQVLLLCYYFYY